MIVNTPTQDESRQINLQLKLLSLNSLINNKKQSNKNLPIKLSESDGIIVY